MITLHHASTSTFSLLAPDTNTAEVILLTQNVVLSVNLVGGWKTPNNGFITGDSINFSIFHLSNEGLYKFYVSDWYGQQKLAIQISISVSGT